MEDQEIKELIENLLFELMPFRPKLQHGYARTNAEVSKEVLFMLIKGANEESILNYLFAVYGYKKETAQVFIERGNILFNLLKRKYPAIVNDGKIRDVTQRKKALPKQNKKALKGKKEIPSTHVNADGSLVEMCEVQSKEEEANKSN